MLHAKPSAQTHTAAPHCGLHCHPAPRILTLHLLCIQHPIFYDNLNFAEATNPHKTIPPSVGRHRERWGKWGEYDFLPPQRWMHNNEHGAAVFLYQ